MANNDGDGVDHKDAVSASTREPHRWWWSWCSRFRRTALKNHHHRQRQKKKIITRANYFEMRNPSKLINETREFHGVRMRRARGRRLMAGGSGFEGVVLTFSQNWLGTFDTRAEFDFFESGKRKTFWRTVTIWEESWCGAARSLGW